MLKVSIWRKIVGSGWSVLEYAWYPLLIFLSTPYLLRTLGVENFGHWMLLTSTIAFGTALNVGTGAATVMLVSASLGQQNKTDTENAVRSSLAVALVSGGLLALLVYCGFRIAGPSVFKQMGDVKLVLMTGVFSSILIWIEQVDGVYSSVLKGAERFKHAARIEMAAKTLQIVAVCATATIHPSMQALYISILLSSIIRVITKHQTVKQQLLINRLTPKFSKLNLVVQYAKWGWLQGIGGLFLGVGDRLIVGSVLGATSLAFYSVVAQLAQQVHALSAAGFSVIFPIISRQQNSKKDHSFTVSALKLILLNFIVSSILAGILLQYGTVIFSMWLGSTQYNAAELLKYLVIAYWLLSINVVTHFILLALGKIEFIAISNIIAGSIAFVLMYESINNYGIIGVAFSRVVYSVVLMANFYYLYQVIKEKTAKNV